MNKDISLIPKGFYCYLMINGRQVNCPYWSINETYPEQNNGYCSYLEKGDWDFTKEIGTWSIRQDDGTYKKVRTSGEEMGLYTGLLFDQVKECGINELTDEELFEEIKIEEETKEYIFPESREERFLDKNLLEFYKKKGYKV